MWNLKHQRVSGLSITPSPGGWGGGNALCTGRVSCLAPPKTLTARAELIPELRPQDVRVQDSGGDIFQPGRADLEEWMDSQGQDTEPRVLTHHLTHSFILSSTQLLLELISMLNPFLKTFLRLPAEPKLKTTHLRPSNSSVICACFPCLTSALTCPLVAQHFIQGFTTVASSRESS